MLEFLRKDRITGTRLIEDTVDFLVKKYKQNKKIFSYSTALGQLTLVLNNLSQLIFYFIKDSTNQNNFATADRIHSVQGLAQLQGHNASRGRSAFGEVTLALKLDAPQELAVGKTIYLTNYSEVKCLNNNLTYLVDLNKDFITLDLNSVKQTSFKIIEGTLNVKSTKGTGEDLQSFPIQVFPNEMIDDNFIVVTVNGTIYQKYESLRDIPYKTAGCLVKTGITSGITIIFGKELIHSIPPLGSEIVVNYLLTKGKAGNINNTNAQFEFVSTGFDLSGKEVNLNDYFQIYNNLPPDFGADAEDIKLTKILAPNISRNFVIHDKPSITYFFGKMNYFSTIKVFRNNDEDPNTYNVLLLPRLIDRLNVSEDYFNADITKFVLSKQEKTRLLNAIHESGIKSGNLTIRLFDPVLRYFSISIFADVFEIFGGKPVKLEDVERDIRTVLSNYMLQNERINKVPHSDIVRIIDEIEAIDTVKVIFHPQYKEDIDEFGNIRLEEDHMSVLRGGFVDFNQIEYTDKFDPNDDSMGSVNIKVQYTEN